MRCYTFLKPNSNPNSEYRKFWDEERRRCWEGYVRESDGEWVTGMLYWFLNYCPMLVNEYKNAQAAIDTTIAPALPPKVEEPFGQVEPKEDSCCA